MPYGDLRGFLTLLEEKGLLIRVRTEVDPTWEINGVTNKLLRKRGPAVIFENVKGHKIPILCGLISTMERFALALEMDTEDERQIREEWIKRIGHPIQPRIVKSGPCKENILLGEQADLRVLFPPVIWHKGDGGPFIGTLATQVTRDPETGVQNTGIYRQMYLTKNETSLMIQPFQHGAQHLQKWQRLFPDKPMPVAVCIGTEPCHIMVAAGKFSHPPSEDAYAGGLRKEPLDLINCETCDLEVPATAEIILEGEVYPKERKTDGPFGEFTGYLSGEQDCYIFHLKAITHRHNPLFQGGRTGYPSEGGIIKRTAMEYLLYERLRGINGVVDVYLPPSGCGFEAIVSIRTLRPGQPFQIMQRIWGDPEVGGYIKHVVVVDETINIRDRDDVAWAIANHVQGDRDVLIIPRCPETSLDISQTYSKRRLTAKMGVDATLPLYDYKAEGREPPPLCDDLNIMAKVETQWEKYNINL